MSTFTFTLERSDISTQNKLVWGDLICRNSGFLPDRRGLTRWVQNQHLLESVSEEAALLKSNQMEPRSSLIHLGESLLSGLIQLIVASHLTETGL